MTQGPFWGPAQPSVGYPRLLPSPYLAGGILLHPVPQASMGLSPAHSVL